MVIHSTTLLSPVGSDKDIMCTSPTACCKENMSLCVLVLSKVIVCCVSNPLIGTEDDIQCLNGRGFVNHDQQRVDAYLGPIMVEDEQL